MEAHDDVASKNYDNVPEFVPVFAPPPQVFQIPPSDAIRMVGIRKTPDEPLVSDTHACSQESAPEKIVQLTSSNRFPEITNFHLCHWDAGGARCDVLFQKSQEK